MTVYRVHWEYGDREDADGRTEEDFWVSTIGHARQIATEQISFFEGDIDIDIVRFELKNVPMKQLIMRCLNRVDFGETIEVVEQYFSGSKGWLKNPSIAV